MQSSTIFYDLVSCRRFLTTLRIIDYSPYIELLPGPVQETGLAQQETVGSVPVPCLKPVSTLYIELYLLFSPYTGPGHDPLQCECTINLERGTDKVNDKAPSESYY